MDSHDGNGSNPGLHRAIGRVSFAFLTVGTVCAIWLAAEHGPVTAYGGNLSMFGFWFMSFCVYGCAVMGIAAIRKGDADAHRIWMIRFVGSMWGAFWLFRVMLFVLGPLLRSWEAAALLICIWFSAPLGILIAEVFRRQLDRRAVPSTGATEGERASANNLRLTRASEMVTPGSSCLDIGSGSGRVAVHLALTNDCRVTGLDSSAEMVDLAIRLAEKAGVADRCAFSHGDFVNYTTSARYDCVLMLGLIDYVENAGEFVASAMAHSKDRVVLSYPRSLRILNPVRKFWLSVLRGVSVHFYSDEEINEIAAAADGHVTSRKRHGRFPFFEDVVVTIQRR